MNQIIQSEKMKYGMAETEAFLRLSAVLILVLTACLVGFDTQTKYVIFFYRKATFRDFNALLLLVYVVSVAAGYNLFQVGKSSLSACFKPNLKVRTNIYLAWICFLLDQMAVYVTFGANSATFQASLLAVTGQEDFQWIKLCSKYTRFCFQIGGALTCGYAACIAMAFISSISAYNLFRLYSPKQFLQLKTAG
ncbi:hypothetical protein DVH24_002351 [Malus domestica]|uniref:CASP-like protein n=1 Tax=Malus domestica TaxID=3750 RepID=A0A498ICG8_MALDO|nr:CASP-like protein 2C1 [Malus domestica]RXH78833.1 hypothetical protein DVH24_002351 [Malus domestica]